MKNIVRLVMIWCIVFGCMILTIAIIHTAQKNREAIEGITRQEVQILLERLYEESIQNEKSNNIEDKINYEDQENIQLNSDSNVFSDFDNKLSFYVTKQDIHDYLAVLQTKSSKWQQALQKDETPASLALQKIDKTYGKKQELQRDDWFEFYEILCEEIQSDSTDIQRIQIQNVFVIRQDDDGNVKSDGVSLENLSNEVLADLTYYRVVVQNDNILSICKMIDESYTLHNVWLVAVQKEEINCFYQNIEFSVENGLDSRFLDTTIQKIVVDLTLKQQKLIHLQRKQNIISGKILRIEKVNVDESVSRVAEKQQVKEDTIIPDELYQYQISLDQDRSFMCSNNLACYKIYGTLENISVTDIKIGYEYADFIIEDNQIEAILLTREEQMKNIDVLLKNEETSNYFYDDFACTSNTSFTVTGNQIDNTLSAGNRFYIKREDLPIGSQITIQTTTNTGTISCIHMKRAQGIPSYHGSITVLSTDSGLVLINEVALEEYLYSVVPSEMPSTYPEEALKAQAICARTYAYQKMLHALYPQFGAHLDDSTVCQVYQNMEEHLTTTEAVNETFGKVVTKQEQPVDTYYYSTSCGYGTTEEIWGNGKQFDYLQARAIAIEETEYAPEDLKEEEAFHKFLFDTEKQYFEYDEPWYRWEYHFVVNMDEFNRKIQNLYAGNPDHVLTYDIETNQWLTKTIPILKQIEELTIRERLSGGIAHIMEVTADGAQYQIITEQAIRTLLASKDTVLRRQDGSEITVGEKLPSAFLCIEPDKDGKNWNIYGGGFGHGVGMSQNATASMAKNGFDAESIIQFFYQGVEIANIYGTK